MEARHILQGSDNNRQKESETIRGEEIIAKNISRWKSLPQQQVNLPNFALISVRAVLMGRKQICQNA